MHEVNIDCETLCLQTDVLIRGELQIYAKNYFENFESALYMKFMPLI